MRVANDVRSSEILRHGAYVCFRAPDGARRAVAGAAVPALAERLGLRNEFDPGDGHPQEAVAFLRRAGATPADIADEELLHADAVVHVAAPTAGPSPSSAPRCPDSWAPRSSRSSSAGSCGP